MRLHIEWSRAINLKDASKQNLIYSVDLAKLPQAPGIYILARRWGSDIEALYVGKANNIRSRIKGQLNNLRLMQHVKNAKAGKRLLLYGKPIIKPGQRLESTLPLIERGLIRYFLSEGHDLVNKQGTRLRRHEILSSGRHPKRFFPRTMFLEKTKS